MPYTRFPLQALNGRNVKTITLGVLLYYKPGAGGSRAVELRESEVPGQYRRTAEKNDEPLGHLDGQGPVSRKLREYGKVLPLCFGVHSEAYREAHKI